MRVNITSRFGDVNRFHPNGHTGIDFSLPEHSVLKAVSEGVVDRIYDGTGAIGKGLSIKFPDGSRAIYGHMSEVKAKVGEHVDAGDVIGFSGNTGLSTGPHLHFGMKDGAGSFIDPTPLAGKLSEFIERGSVENNDYPSVWGWLNEAVISNGVNHWLANFSVALPIVLGVGIGVYGLLNMFSSKIAAWGVVGVFAFASIISISI
jgi:hypothetical protein